LTVILRGEKMPGAEDGPGPVHDREGNPHSIGMTRYDGGMTAVGSPRRGPGYGYSGQWSPGWLRPRRGALPGELGDRGHLVAGLEWGRGHGDHRDCRDSQERGQQAAGVIVPGRGPGDVEDLPEHADPFPVRWAQANRFFPGQQVVFGEPLRALHGAIGIEDAIHGRFKIMT
jgi:hypothetical protein